MAAEAIRWTCGRCKVSVGRIDGGSASLPTTWSRSEGLSYCLSCSRARAIEVAMESAPESTSADDRSRLRRKAVIEFEIERTPEAPDRVIASACRTTSRAVAAVRDDMTCVSAVPELDAAQAV